MPAPLAASARKRRTIIVIAVCLAVLCCAGGGVWAWENGQQQAHDSAFFSCQQSEESAQTAIASARNTIEKRKPTVCISSMTTQQLDANSRTNTELIQDLSSADAAAQRAARQQR